MAGSSSTHHYYFSNNLSKMVVLVATAVTAILSLNICCADYGYTYTRATYYGSPECYGTPTGACGFGEYGSTVNNGEVSGVSRLYRNGSGCGACYQVRCKIPTHCRYEGTNVVVTDYGEGDNTDFILSARAYTNLAKPNMAAQLLAYGVVDVEYRRIPCRYGRNLMIKVHEGSRFPNYLAIVAMYQAGMYDITAVQFWVEDCNEWRSMRRAFGAVWDMENPPVGAAVNLRFQLASSGRANAEVKWVQIANVIPADWEAGVVYDTSIQLS